MSALDPQMPEGNLEKATRTTSRPIGQAFALIGLLWQSLFIYGLAQFVPLMLGTFRAITESGAADPRLMAEGIGKALVPVVFWGAVGVFGLLTTLITMLVSRYRAAWWFWASWAFSLLYLLFIPVGTVLAIGLIIVLILKRREFRVPSNSGASIAEKVPMGIGSQ